MTSTKAVNKNSSACKRILSEAQELANDTSTLYSAAPLEEDIFEWHCTLRGPEGTEFEGGLYHFRILLPPEYPFKSPSIEILTPNGRFELNKKICISFTSYHEELWQPAWGIRTAIVGLQGFFPLKGQAAIGVGSMESAPAERRRLAAISRDWICPNCKCPNIELLPDPPTRAASQPPAGPSNSSESPHQSESVVVAPLAAPLAIKEESTLLSVTRLVEGTPLASTVVALDVPESSDSRAQLSEQEQEAPVYLAPQTVATNARSRPPMLLDATIFGLVALLFALLYRRIM